MQSEKFDELWTQVSNAAEDIVCTCGDDTKFNSEKKSYIRYEYEKLRDECKKQYLHSARDADDSEQKSLLDRHKVAACIAGAILSAKPLEEPTMRSSDQIRCRLSYFSNETLALLAALGIVKSFIASDKENVIGFDAALKSEFLKNGFMFPTPARDDYIPWLLFLLHESSKIGYNVLSFSNILYLLETFTFAQLEIKALKEPLEH